MCDTCDKVKKSWPKRCVESVQERETVFLNIEGSAHGHLVSAKLNGRTLQLTNETPTPGSYVELRLANNKSLSM